MLARVYVRVFMCVCESLCVRAHVRGVCDGVSVTTRHLQEKLPLHPVPHLPPPFSGQEKRIPPPSPPHLQEKLARRVRSVEVKVLSPPRPGKKCLVLDIDYTLFDLGR